MRTKLPRRIKRAGRRVQKRPPQRMALNGLGPSEQALQDVGLLFVRLVTPEIPPKKLRVVLANLEPIANRTAGTRRALRPILVHLQNTLEELRR